MATQPMDFWFTTGSTYTYLTAMRLAAAAEAAGVSVRWRPFESVRALTGATQLPFLAGTAKMRYMWRDIERRAAKYGLDMRRRVPYPAPDSVRSNRIALVGMQEGWGQAYVIAAYRLWFQHGLCSGSDENLRRSLPECGQAGQIDRILELADGASVSKELDLATDEARRLGVFGSPSFVIGTELFWGDDHLEEALQWARRGRLEGDPSAPIA